MIASIPTVAGVDSGRSNLCHCVVRVWHGFIFV
jgi:hypothetical protein